jgi:hypothetical protein
MPKINHKILSMRDIFTMLRNTICILCLYLFSSDFLFHFFFSCEFRVITEIVQFIYLFLFSLTLNVARAWNQFQIRLSSLVSEIRKRLIGSFGDPSIHVKQQRRVMDFCFCDGKRNIYIYIILY